MRGQRGLNGGSYLNLRPAFLLVGTAKELVAERIVAQNLMPATIRDLQVLVEPRISGNEWYLFAAPGPFSIVEYGSLASRPGIQLDVRDGFGVLGTEFRAVLHFGAGAVDYRGAFKNVGA